jgi:prepilin-type N-terminal cleavage/methylation domain-containing protein
MNKLLETQKGFTLIELVVGLSIAAIVMAGIAQLMAVSVKIEADASNREACVQAVRSSLGIISEEIENADVIAAPALSDSSDSITYMIDGVQHTIETEENYIRIIDGSNEQRFRATGIQPLTFTRDAANPRRVNIRISAQNRNASYTLETSVVALNNI